MTVEFRILGDAEVRVDGHRLEIGHARRWCVLVALLFDVNHAISPEQLAERVWSDQPPLRARNSLAGYISRIRTLLAQAEGVEISRGPAGYTLTTDPMSVDLHKFRHLAAQARAIADPGGATQLFDRALQIWAGEPLMFLDSPWVNQMRSALRAERFSLELDRNDAALRAGRHAELLVELTAAQAIHALDERLAGQLMIAQYRCGRQADALDTYRRVRLRLIEKLGVEPGQLLTEVHQQILTGQAERHGTGPDAAPVILERPQSEVLRRASSFIGHDSEMAQAVRALRGGPLVTLTGVGGVGKTRLAWEIAHSDQVRFGDASFSDGVWTCELGPLDHGDAVGHTLAAALRLKSAAGPGHRGVGDRLPALARGVAGAG